MPPQQQSDFHRWHGFIFRKGVKTQLTRAALGFAACQSKKGNTLIIRLLPLQGVGGVWVPFTQGAALGYVLLPLRGVLFMSFDTPSP